MTTINRKAEAALRDPDTRQVLIEMTEERKARFRRAGHQITDLLKANTANPIEAYMLLQFVVEAFEAAYDIRGGVILGNDEKH